MTPSNSAGPRLRRTYSHRLREHVVRCGPKAVANHVHIPRSTASTWRRHGLRPVVTTEPAGQDLQHALDSSARWERRARLLAAVARLLLALLRASAFSLDGNRLLEGKQWHVLARWSNSTSPSTRQRCHTQRSTGRHLTKSSLGLGPTCPGRWRWRRSMHGQHAWPSTGRCPAGPAWAKPPPSQKRQFLRDFHGDDVANRRCKSACVRSTAGTSWRRSGGSAGFRSRQTRLARLVKANRIRLSCASLSSEEWILRRAPWSAAVVAQRSPCGRGK
jgi:hypothetical protein